MNVHNHTYIEHKKENINFLQIPLPFYLLAPPLAHAQLDNTENVPHISRKRLWGCLGRWDGVGKEPDIVRALIQNSAGNKLMEKFIS